MTDTTDIAALRNKFGTKLPTSDDAKEKFIELLSAPHACSWFLAPYAIAFLDALEAERQRADDEAALNKHLDLAVRQNEGINNNLRRRAVRAEAELAALKGDQVPVAFTAARWLDTRCKVSVWTDRESAALSVGDKSRLIELFTAPQKPIVHPDTKRMDWLCAHVVEVRQPLFYGSHAMFYGQCDSDDCEEYHSKLREQVDAAIEAAGGWVCTSDERMMQDMSGIAVEQHFRENAETSTNCPKCGGCGSYHCLQVCGTVECECGAVKTEDKHAKP